MIRLSADWLPLGSKLIAAACTAAALLVLVTSDSPVPLRGEEQVYQETILSPDPAPIDAENPSVAPGHCQCWEKSVENDEYYWLSGFGGMSYFDSDSDTSGGGMYGLRLGAPIIGAITGYASGQVNHYEGGTQWGGTLGIYKPAFAGDSLQSRIGWAAVFDQATDTGLGSPYLAQGRYTVNYALSSDLFAGVVYTDPLHGDDVAANAVVPGAGTAPISLTPVEIIEAQLAIGRSSFNSLVFGVGYIDDYESMTYRTAINRPLNDRVSATLSMSYDDEVGRWSGFLGFQVDISGNAARRQHLFVNNSRSSDVVRGGAFSAAVIGESFGDVDFDELGGLTLVDPNLPGIFSSAGVKAKQALRGAQLCDMECPPGTHCEIVSGGQMLCVPDDF